MVVGPSLETWATTLVFPVSTLSVLWQPYCELRYMSSIDNIAYEEEFLLKFVTRLSAYVTFACGTVLTHDTLTNLDFEVKYIWKAKLSVIKVLYLLTRYMAYINVVLALWYFTFGHNLTPRMCENAATAVYWLDAIGICLSEIMVATRTWAIWGRNRKIAVGMVCLYLGCVAGGVYTIYMFFQSAIITSNPGLPGCFVEGSSLMMKLSWVMMLIGNSALLVLLLIESYLVYKETRSFPALYKTVISDGVLYFVLLSVLVILVIVPIPSGFDFNMTAILSVPGRILYSVLTTHFILHVKRVADPDSSYEASTLPVSTFRVAHHSLTHP